MPPVPSRWYEQVASGVARETGAMAATAARCAAQAIVAVRGGLLNTFLPAGYPDSVRPEYVRYRCWDILQVRVSVALPDERFSAVLRGMRWAGAGKIRGGAWAPEELDVVGREARSGAGSRLGTEPADGLWDRHRDGVESFGGHRLTRRSEDGGGKGSRRTC